MFFWMRGNKWERMGTNGTKKGDLGVHGGQNVLLWYYQIIKIITFDEKIEIVTSTDWCFFMWRDYANYRERIVVVETICE